MASKCLVRPTTYRRVAFRFRQPTQISQFRLTSSLPPSLPSIATCPSPRCAYAPTPKLEIDRVKPLASTVPNHKTHVVVHTGRYDWASRIEEDDQTPNIAKELKALVGPKGEFYETTSGSIMITNCSFGPAGSVTVYPEGKHYVDLREYRGVYSDFVRMALLPEDRRVDPPGKLPFRDHTLRSTPTIFVCGHGGRDVRCGVMGPLLRDEFMSQTSAERLPKTEHGENTPRVALISHIGGHAFAGNVIIYFPRHTTGHALAGKGVWYGRVEPRHVEGILKETMEKGIIIRDLFRGGLDADGSPLRLEKE